MIQCPSWGCEQALFTPRQPRVQHGRLHLAGLARHRHRDQIAVTARARQGSLAQRGRGGGGRQLLRRLKKRNRPALIKEICRGRRPAASSRRLKKRNRAALKKKSGAAGGRQLPRGAAQQPEERRVPCARAAASHSPQCHSEAGSGSGEQGGSGLRAEYTNLRAGEDGSVQSIPSTA